MHPYQCPQAGSPVIRIDFFVLNRTEVYVGEATYTSAACYMKWKPNVLQLLLGEVSTGPCSVATCRPAIPYPLHVAPQKGWEPSSARCVPLAYCLACLMRSNWSHHQLPARDMQVASNASATLSPDCIADIVESVQCSRQSPYNAARDGCCGDACEAANITVTLEDERRAFEAHDWDADLLVGSAPGTRGAAASVVAAGWPDSVLEDDPAFRDRNGYACPGWKGISCHGDWSGDGYSNADMLAVRTGCPETCSWSSH